MKKISCFLICILLLFCFLSFSSCDSATDSIGAISIIDWEVFEIDIDFYHACAGGNTTTFLTKLSLNDIKKQLIKNGLSVEQYGEDFLLIRKAEDFIGVNYYMVAKLDNEDQLIFMCPSYSIYEDYNVLFPFHLLGFNSNSLPNGYYEGRVNTEYKINSTYREIADFYKAVKPYTVVEEPFRILITFNEKLSIQYRDRKNPISKPFLPTKESAPIGGSIAIDFEEKEDGTYVVYSIVDNE